MAIKRMQARWMLVTAGWVTLAVCLTLETGAGTLWQLYPEAYELTTDPRREGLWTFVAVLAFGVASVAVTASPLLLLASYSHNPVIRMMRSLGFAGLLCAPVVVVLIDRNEVWYGFVMLGIAHVLIAAAVVPWPGERLESRGFEVLPEAATVTETENDASPKV